LLAKKQIQINQAANDGTTPLFMACQNDCVKIVNLLLARKDIQINQARDNGATPLLTACWYGHVNVVKALLAKKEIDINNSNKSFEGWTDNIQINPVAIALREGHTEIVALLRQHESYSGGHNIR